MKNAYYYDTPYGKMGIAEKNGFLTYVYFRDLPPEYPIRQTPLIQEAAAQLTAYFQGKLQTFDLPLKPEGTPFEHTVWDILLAIPYGSTRTYGDIARQLNKPKAARAVGRANGHNPISIIIPCHRVIGSNGALTGYAWGEEMKRSLLEMERQK